MSDTLFKSEGLLFRNHEDKHSNSDLNPSKTEENGRHGICDPKAVKPSLNPMPLSIRPNHFQAKEAIKLGLREFIISNGIDHELVAKLRTHVVQQLKSISYQPHRNSLQLNQAFASPSGLKPPFSNQIVHSICNFILLDFLRSKKLEYTISIYLPETGQEPVCINIFF
jgi:hypothetical protein